MRLGHSHIYFLLRHFSLCFVTCIHRHNRKAEGLHSSTLNSVAAPLLLYCSLFIHIAAEHFCHGHSYLSPSLRLTCYLTLYRYAPSSLESTLSPPFPFFANAPLISDAQLGSTLFLGAARGSQVTPGHL